MTDRHNGYVVVLAKDSREDDAQAIVAALGMIKGVLSVEPITADIGSLTADVRAWYKMADRFTALLKESKP